MKYAAIWMLALMSVVGLAAAGDVDDGVSVGRHQVMVQVHGVVCSFCAYGTEKNLAKLPFLDSSKYGNGVLMDIRTHRITLAVQPDQQIDVAGVYNAILKGGYDPVTIYLGLHGEVTKDGDRYLIACPENDQVFEVMGEVVAELVGRGAVDIQAQADAEAMISASPDQPVRVVMVEQGDES